MAVTVGVGAISAEAKKLVRATRAGLEAALKTLRPGATLGDVGFAVQSVAAKAGLSVIRDLVGHGVGLHVHEDPLVPNFGKPGEGVKLQAGMVLAIEPMFATGSHQLRMRSDGWGIKMADGRLCAHFEKTVAITQDGFLLLTP